MGKNEESRPNSADGPEACHLSELKANLKKIQWLVIELVKAANNLPKCSGSHEFHSSFPLYVRFMVEKQKILRVLIRRLLRSAGCRLPAQSEIVDIDDYVYRIVEANDTILERVGLAMDVFSRQGRDGAAVPQLSLQAESALISSCHSKLPQQRFKTLIDRAARSNNPLAKCTSTRVKAFQKSYVKPQDAYNMKVGNGSERFVPKLKIKHNSLPKLPGSLKMIDVNSNDEINISTDQELQPHPYFHELLHHKIFDWQLEIDDVQIVKALSETLCVFIHTKDELEKLCDTLNSQREFSVDLEHHSLRSFLGLTCLIQISTRNCDYIIDPFPLWNDIWMLNEPFTNPNIVKIFHGSDMDLLWLQRDFGIFVVNLFDTYHAMKMLNFPKFSLQYLIQTYHNLVLDKRLQRSDWSIRPLAPAQMEYARKDTHYLLSCYDSLRQKLLNTRPGLLEEVYELSKKICFKLYEKPVFVSNGYEKLLHGRKKFNNRQKYALSELWKWRDCLARLEDESIHYVLPNHMLLQITEVLPREQQGILACCSPIPKLLKHELYTIHRIINAARDLSLKKAEETFDVATFASTAYENILASLNKMNKTKALLECSLDFSSTKFDEEIGSAVERTLARISAMPPPKKTDNTEVTCESNIYEIGPPAAFDFKCMRDIISKLEEWATPFESYMLTLKETIENMKVHGNAENKEHDAESSSNNQKMWSHLDAASKPTELSDPNPSKNSTPQSTGKFSVTASNSFDSSWSSSGSNLPKRVVLNSTTIEEVDGNTVLTEKATKKNLKRAKKFVDIPLTDTSSKRMKHSSFNSNKESPISNWTKPIREVPSVNYEQYSSKMFNGTKKDSARGTTRSRSSRVQIKRSLTSPRSSRGEKRKHWSQGKSVTYGKNNNVVR